MLDALKVWFFVPIETFAIVEKILHLIDIRLFLLTSFVALWNVNREKRRLVFVPPENIDAFESLFYFTKSSALNIFYKKHSDDPETYPLSIIFYSFHFFIPRQAAIEHFS